MTAVNRMATAPIPTTTIVGQPNDVVGEVLLNSLLDAKTNEAYYEGVYASVQRSDKRLRIIVAVTSPSTLGGVGAWAAFPTVSIWIKGATAVLAVLTTIAGLVSATLAYSGVMARIATVYNEYVSLSSDAGRLCDYHRAGKPVTIEQAEEIKTKLTNLNQKQLEMPRTQKIWDWALKEGRKRTGLPQSEDASETTMPPP